MAISLECTGCGKKLKVKDEAAGKRIKCPECQAVLSVPKPEAADNEDDFLGGLDEAVKQEKKRPSRPVDDEDDAEDYDDLPASTPKRRTKQTSSKKKSSSGGGSGGGTLKIIGSVFFGLLICLGILGKVAKVARVGGLFDQKVAWQRFNSPQGGASIDMPGPPQLDAQQTKDAGSPVYSVKGSRFQCSFASVGLPPGAGDVAGNALASQMVFNEMKRAYVNSHPTARLVSETPLQQGTVKGLELRFEASGAINVSRLYLTNAHIIVAEFVSAKANESATDRDHFFSSLQLAGGPAPGAGPPGMTMPGTNAPGSMPPGMTTPMPHAGP